MKIEIERKYKTSNLKDVEKALRKLKAGFVKSSETKDIYFRVPEKIKNTRYLRIRIKDKETNGELAYHEVINDLKPKEWETKISDSKICEEIIKKLSFPVDVVVVKKRKEYKIGKSLVLLDSIRGLGNFVEIETINPKKLEELRTKLKLKEENIISGAGYPDLLKEKYALRTK